MEDIEDLVKTKEAAVDLTKKRVTAPKVVRPHNNVSSRSSDAHLSNSVPGSAKIYTKTYGCSHNWSDSEYMVGQLVEYGYTMVESPNEADVWLINSCTVKNPSQEHFVGMIKKADTAEKPIVVAGCVPQGDRKMKDLEGISIVGVQQIERIVEVVEETLKGHTVRLLGKRELPRLDLPKIRRNPYVEIVPVNTGCLGRCTYCKTKHARGELGSYTVEAIVDRVKSVILEGVREIWLTSEDTGAYGLDLETNVAELLRAIVDVLPDGVMLKIGMTNPPYMLGHIDTICEILNHPRVFSFLHIPVQSGSNKVLEDMKREYTIEEFKLVADAIREKCPGALLATDIIAAFPGETEEEWQESMKLVEEYKFPVLNFTQFYPRPGTPAAKMKKVPTKIARDRTRELSKLFESYQTFDHLEGESLRVWFSETNRDGSQTVGHTKGYVQTLVPRDDSLLGTSKIVKITKTSKWCVIGEVVKDIPTNLPPLKVLKPKQALTVTKESASKEQNKTVTSQAVDVPLTDRLSRHVAVVCAGLIAFLFALYLQHQ